MRRQEGLSFPGSRRTFSLQIPQRAEKIPPVRRERIVVRLQAGTRRQDVPRQFGVKKLVVSNRVEQSLPQDQVRAAGVNQHYGHQRQQGEDDGKRPPPIAPHLAP